MISTRRHSHWLIALLILVFVGQSMAAGAMPCQLMIDSNATAHAMDNMDHSMMSMHHDMSQLDYSDSAQTSSKMHDCCKTMSHCGSGSCSLPGLSYSLVLGIKKNTQAIIDNYAFTIPPHPISSLYRPPIFS